jgi:hypothetical protein
MANVDSGLVGPGTAIGRRRFLASLGAGVAGVLTLNDVEALAATVEGPIPDSVPNSRFGRMFQPSSRSAAAGCSKNYLVTRT